MKKSLLFFAIAMGVVALVGCTEKRGWSHDDRKAVRNEIDNYRDMVYLEDLEVVEFDDFSGDVIEAIEIDYPTYALYYELPGRGDTLDVYVVSTIVERLDTDPHNLRHIFPYSWLVAEGVLPADLDKQAQRAFYDCLSQKVKRQYHTSRRFLYALMNDPNAGNAVMQMQNDCAMELFDWGMEVDETVVVETTN
jgi:hypothetical protein